MQQCRFAAPIVADQGQLPAFADGETEIPEENFFVWMDIGDLLYLNTHGGLLF
ncbi:hypothetical protein M141_1391 [Bacteroides fragilis str. S38L5]|nr:hypothetical protein M065_2300 [Bacteroides fragilis str. Korea 419]EYA96570.1 hypothetical protein M141_1391 [Bacteroides fragilis str. S38L5]EYB15604.1 hypothetical protein M140_1335 [Bacteroides fragilis str. S38L3]